MESIKRGFLFFVQAWRLARANPGLVEPLSYGLLAGLLITLVLLAPVAAALIFLEGNPIGGLIAGFVVILWLFILPAVSYVFASVTVPGTAAVMHGEPPDPASIKAELRRWPDLLSLALALIPVSLLRRRGGEYFRAPWNAAPYLVRPVLLLEEPNLKDSLGRVSEMVRANLLLMAPAQVGVWQASLLINLVVWLCAGGLAFLAGNAILRALPGNAGLILGLLTGALIFALLTLISSGVTAFVTAAYHACLYQWARQVEGDRQSDTAVGMTPPALLAQSLAGAASFSAPIFSE